MKTIFKNSAWLLSLVLFATVTIGCRSNDDPTDPFVANAATSRIDGDFKVGEAMTAANVFVVNFTGGGTATIVRAVAAVNGISIETQNNVTLSGGTLRIPLTGTPVDPGEHELRVEIVVANVPHIVPATFNVTEDGDGNDGPFDGGTGSAANPWLISTAEQLDLIRDYPTRHFKLTSSVDLADLDDEWVPIGVFSGSIDGDGNSVYGLVHTSIDNDEGGGFVNTLYGTGIIRNIAFRDIDMTTTARFGAIVGIHYGEIDNMVVTGRLISNTEAGIGTGWLGGISGEMRAGALNNAFVNLEIRSYAGMTGGVVGRAINQAYEIANVTAQGSITLLRGGGMFRVGGILARAESSATQLTVRNNYVTMDIGAIDGESVEGVGGIFGACGNPANMTIVQNKFAGTIFNARQAGGISGAGPRVSNNLVVGRGRDLNHPTISVASAAAGGGTAGAIAGQGKFNLNNNIARNVTITGASFPTRPISGIASDLAQNVETYNNVIINTLLNGAYVSGMTGVAAPGTGRTENNFRSNMSFYAAGVPSDFVPVDDADGRDGANVATVDLAFLTGLGFDFNTVWEMRSGVPYLRNVGYYGDIPTN